MKKQLTRLSLLVVGLIFIAVWLTSCRDKEMVEPTATPEPTSQPTAAPTATPLYVPVFETADCQFQLTGAARIECGYLVVPEDRVNPERMIRIQVAIITSNSENPAPDPVVYLNGGPGGDTVDFSPSYAQLFQPVLRERNLILFDQRGTGYSEPLLNCPEYEAAYLDHIDERLSDDEIQTFSLEALAACRERLLVEGVDLAAYNSAASAADLDDLRRALGYESWNLFGVSYGTRLALTTMRDFGSTGTIRSVILDSVYPPQVDGIGLIGPNAGLTFALLFDRCAAIEQCNRDYPELENRFYQLVDDLNAEPMNIVITDRANRTTYRIPFDGNDLIYTFFRMMYDSRQIINLPKMISQMEDGVSMILTNYLTNTFNEPATISEGMRLSVQCFEEMPFRLDEEEQSNNESLPTQLGDLFKVQETQFMEWCQFWQAGTADPLENEPVRSDIPTLILAGDYDPITPPYYARETAEFLNQSYYYEFEGIGHGVTFSDDCGFDLVVEFLNQPDTPPDDACLEHLFIGFVPK